MVNIRKTQRPSHAGDLASAECDKQRFGCKGTHTVAVIHTGLHTSINTSLDPHTIDGGTTAREGWISGSELKAILTVCQCQDLLWEVTHNSMRRTTFK